MAKGLNDQKLNKKLNKKPNKLCKTIRFFLSLVLILGLGYVLFNYVPFIAKYDTYVIVTNSMVPVINVDDVAVIDSSFTIDDLNNGDIIAFLTDINGDGTDEVVVHYLYSVEEINGETVIKSIAHGSEQPDRWDLSEDDIIGKHVLTIRKIGSFLRFASSTFGKIVLVFDVLIIYLLFEIFADDKKKKDDKNNIVNKKKQEKPEE